MAPYHDWRSSVEAAPPGSTVSFSPGVYRGCNVTLRTGECVGDTLPQCYAAHRSHRTCIGAVCYRQIRKSVCNPKLRLPVALAGVVLTAEAEGAVVIDCEHMARFTV